MGCVGGAWGEREVQTIRCTVSMQENVRNKHKEAQEAKSLHSQCVMARPLFLHLVLMGIGCQRCTQVEAGKLLCRERKHVEKKEF